MIKFEATDEWYKKVAEDEDRIDISIGLRMMAFLYKYKLLLKFAKEALNYTCCLCACEGCIACKAKEVLDNIGELNGR